MDGDDARTGRKRVSSGLDPAFVRRLEDDSSWRTDRGARRARPEPPRRERRSRLLAAIVLILVVLAIVFTGIGAGSDSSGAPGGGDASPFSILPLPGDTSPDTTEADESSEASPGSASPGSESPGSASPGSASRECVSVESPSPGRLAFNADLSYAGASSVAAPVSPAATAVPVLAANR